MKKFLAALVALVLIGIVLGIGIGKPILDKYSYGTDYANLAEYFRVSGEEAAILLGSERLEDKAIVKDGVCYFSKDTVDEYITDDFYFAPDYKGGCLLYTGAVKTFELALGDNAYELCMASGMNLDGSSVCSDRRELGFVGAFMQGDTIYIAADYVKYFADFSYQVFASRVQLYTEEQAGSFDQMRIVKDTQIRVLGGVKSDILRDLAADETVELLQEMENWSKVKTSDALVGYVENKRMERTSEGTISVENHTEVLEEYDSLLMDKKVCLGFHSIGGVGGNDTLAEMAAEGTGMNVIAPTWFSLNDDQGNYRSFGTADYVVKAHSQGLRVWGVLDNFNYENETGNGVSDLAVLSDTTKRRKLAANIVNDAMLLGLDGINIDFEGLASEVGIHYVQFLKELSVLCREHQLVLSVDNYVPFNFNSFYRLDVQGRIADYVIIMGYDEHYHGSKDPGSVASIGYVTNGIEKTLESVAKEKVINALPFYTSVWKTEGSIISDSYVTLNNQAEYMERVGQTASWDETTCQNYAQWKSGDAFYQIWLEDVDSIQVKLNVMNAHEIGGVAVWRLGYGTQEVWNLIQLYTLMP